MNGNLLQGDEETPQERQKQRVKWLGRKSKQGEGLTDNGSRVLYSY